jgi:hypothetical protein
MTNILKFPPQLHLSVDDRRRAHELVGELQSLPARTRAAIIVWSCADDDSNDELSAIACFAAYMLGPNVLAAVQAGLLDAIEAAS